MELYGLVGKTLGHSISPFVHSLFGSYEYRLMPMGEEEFRDFLAKREFRGINVTIPYKRLALELCDELTDSAKRVGCVNTVVCENGRLTGDNTDLPGFGFALARAGISLKDRRVLIFGSGGTSLTVTEEAKREGAKSIDIVSRTGRLNYGNVREECASCEVIVNTTPVGMFPDCGGKITEISFFPKLVSVVDVVYNPLESELIRDARRKSLLCTGGLPMLVAQAAFASSRFTGRSVGITEIDEAVEKTLSAMTNLVLIGMPGSGKSFIGKRCAGIRNREFFDTDAIIEQKAGMKIEEIFALYGEKRFRELEREAVAEASAGLGRVIATGGGAVLDRANIDALGRNGRLIFLDRDIKKLPVSGRPLSEKSLLSEMESKRRPLYIKYSDAVVKNDVSAAAAAEKVWEAFDEAIGD